VIRLDEFTFSLARLWAAACLLIVLDVILLSWTLTGASRVGALMAWMPRPVSGVVFLFGPFIVAAIWALVVALAVGFHGRRGLWLLLTALVILPATYLHWGLVWECAVRGQCL
jgi:hypothetical protein